VHAFDYVNTVVVLAWHEFVCLFSCSSQETTWELERPLFLSGGGTLDHRDASSTCIGCSSIVKPFAMCMIFPDTDISRNDRK